MATVWGRREKGMVVDGVNNIYKVKIER